MRSASFPVEEVQSIPIQLFDSFKRRGYIDGDAPDYVNKTGETWSWLGPTTSTTYMPWCYQDGRFVGQTFGSIIQGAFIELSNPASKISGVIEISATANKVYIGIFSDGNYYGAGTGQGLVLEIVGVTSSNALRFRANNYPGGLPNNAQQITLASTDEIVVPGNILNTQYPFDIEVESDSILFTCEHGSKLIDSADILAATGFSTLQNMSNKFVSIMADSSSGTTTLRNLKIR